MPRRDSSEYKPACHLSLVRGERGKREGVAVLQSRVPISSTSTRRDQKSDGRICKMIKKEAGG